MYVDNNNPQSASKLNDTSIVIELAYINTKYLFIGDISNKMDSKIKGIEEIDVLKVAHHGSKETTSDEFLKLVKPKYAIISAGKNEKLNHPSTEVITRLKHIGIKEENIYITKNHGTIWLKSDGNTITIETRQDINLDGANRIGYKSIFKYVLIFCKD